MSHKVVTCIFISFFMAEAIFLLTQKLMLKVSCWLQLQQNTNQPTSTKNVWQVFFLHKCQIYEKILFQFIKKFCCNKNFCGKHIFCHSFFLVIITLWAKARVQKFWQFSKEFYFAVKSKPLALKWMVKNFFLSILNTFFKIR